MAPNKQRVFINGGCKIQQNELSKEVGTATWRGGFFLYNSPSSFWSAKEYFSCYHPNFFSTCVLAVSSILFSNYHAILLTVFKHKTLFYLKFFQDNVILLQVFPKKVITNKHVVPWGDGGRKKVKWEQYFIVLIYLFSL